MELLLRPTRPWRWEDIDLTAPEVVEALAAQEAACAVVLAAHAAALARVLAQARRMVEDRP